MKHFGEIPGIQFSPDFNFVVIASFFWEISIYKMVSIFSSNNNLILIYCVYIKIDGIARLMHNFPALNLPFL